MVYALLIGKKVAFEVNKCGLEAILGENWVISVNNKIFQMFSLLKFLQYLVHIVLVGHLGGSTEGGHFYGGLHSGLDIRRPILDI